MTEGAGRAWPALTIASAAGAAAAAAWLLPASIHIAAWPASGPARIALFAPLATLEIIAAAACVLIAVTVAGGARVDRLADVAWLVAPIQWLWLWALPFLPWIPDRLPLVLVFAGPLRWSVLVGAALAVLLRAWRQYGWHMPPTRHVPRWAVFAVSLLLYAGFAIPWNRDLGLGGDEPHYLVIAHSLLVDRDLDIENNHRQGDYRAFFGGDLAPDYLARGRHGELYSIHAPGLPALLLPSYSIAGATGAVLFMVLVGALAALAIFDLAALVAGERAALATWAALAFSVPFLPHAWLIYPEMPAALLIALAALWLIDPDPPASAWRWAIRGLVLALLPLLHTKFAVVLAIVVPALLFKQRREWRSALAFASSIAIVCGLWLWSFYVMYGVFDPQAPYGTYQVTYVKTANVPRGLAGLLVDQKFGLLVFAPIYLMALRGIRRFVREQPLAGWTSLAAVGAFVFTTTRLYMWWGGSSAPARFLVPIVPLLALWVASGFRQLGRGATAIAAVAAAAGIGIGVGGVIAPADMLLLSDPHGDSRLLAAVEGPAPLTSIWPTFTEEDGLAAFARSASALAGRLAPDSRAAIVTRGRMRLLDAFDGAHLRAFDYGRFSRIDDRSAIASAGIDARRSTGQLNEDPARLAGPFDLPPGSYRVSVSFNADVDGAEVFAHVHRGPAFARSTAVGRTAVLDLELPVPAPTLWIGTTAAVAPAAERVSVVANTVEPRSQRPPVDPVAIEPIEGRGLLAYDDRESYPEGGIFWTRGTATANVHVAPAGATRMTVALHVGPNAGVVHVAAGGERHAVTLPADGTAEVVFPVTGSRLVPVTIQAAHSFVPALTNPKSDDRRALGCQVHIRLN